MKLRVLVTGTNGQLGKHVCKLKPGHIDLFPFTSAELDITNRDKTVQVIADIEPDLVINAAAYTNVDLAETEQAQAFEVNETGPENLASCLPAKSRLIHISTDFVFDGLNNKPYKPGDTVNPLSIYGKSKLGGELKIQHLLPERSLILRTAWVYSSEGSNFLKTMLRLMQTRDELTVVNDQRGTPSSAAELAKVIWLFADKPQCHGIYHWTDQGQTTWYGFACAIQELALEKGILEKEITIRPVSTAEYPTPATRPAWSVLDKTATYDVLGYEGHGWKQALSNVLDTLTRQA